MCHFFAFKIGWISVAGLIIEFIGFLVLLRVTVKDLIDRFYDMTITQKVFSEIADMDGGIAYSKSMWKIMQRKTRRRLYAGAFVVLVGLVLQVAASIPC